MVVVPQQQAVPQEPVLQQVEQQTSVKISSSWSYACPLLPFVFDDVGVSFSFGAIVSCSGTAK